MNFPEKLKALRKEKGLTQEELSREIFVSRSLISKYESEAVYPTKENAEKLALYFDVRISDLIDNEDTVQLILKKNDNTDKINFILSCIIITICSLATLLVFIPMLKVSYYDYSQGVPLINYKIVSPLSIALCNNNPIVIITIISLIANSVLSIFNIKIKDNVWLKLISYLLFVINLFLIFFSIVFVTIYCSNNSIDF